MKAKITQKEMMRQRRVLGIRESGLTPKAYDALMAERNVRIEAQRDAARRAAEATEQKQQAFVLETVHLDQGLPDAGAVALSLSRRHDGGRPVKLADLLVEAGMAETTEDAVRLCRQLQGQALAEALHALGWERSRRRGVLMWKPPVTRGALAP